MEDVKGRAGCGGSVTQSGVVLKTLLWCCEKGQNGENKPQCAMDRTQDGSKSSTEDKEEKDEQ